MSNNKEHPRSIINFSSSSQQRYDLTFFLSTIIFLFFSFFPPFIPSENVYLRFYLSQFHLGYVCWNWRYSLAIACLPLERRGVFISLMLGGIDRKALLHPPLFQSAISYPRCHPEGFRSYSSTFASFSYSPRERVAIRQQSEIQFTRKYVDLQVVP